MEPARKDSPPTPAYESFKMTKGAYGVWWTYEWRPTVALGVLGVGSLAVGFYCYYVRDLRIVISTIIAVAAGVLIGLSYNMLATHKNWQKLHWLDIFLFSYQILP